MLGWDTVLKIWDCLGAATSTAASGDGYFGLDVVSGPIIIKIGGQPYR